MQSDASRSRESEWKLVSEPSSAIVEIAIAVVQDGDRFLVGLRGDDVPLAGHSEFPGGKLHPGETPEAAALRECAEEAGLSVQIVGTYPPVLYDYPHGHVRLNFFDCRPTELAQAPEPPFRWVSRQELKGLTFPAANASLIAHLTGRR